MVGAPRFWTFAAGWAALIFALSSVPGRKFPDLKVLSYDKVLHGGVYAVLGALCFLAIRKTWSLRTSWLIGASVVAATLYGVSDELHQSFVPGRSVDMFDVLADCIGSLVGSAAAAVALPLAEDPR
ncbi:MAG TPA: VanZ family protein [Polyangiaceae bacterium]|nr:VanZ family protein [Polyangiaceae bacterium]